MDDNKNNNNKTDNEKSNLSSDKPKPRGDESPTQTRQPKSTVADEPALKKVATQVTCPVCHANVLSEIKHVKGIATYVACFAIAAIGCFCGCCLLPFCSKTFKDVEHTCPNCKSSLGTVSVVS